MKKFTIFLLFVALASFLNSCGNGAQERAKSPETDLSKVAEPQKETHGAEIKEMKLTSPLDAAMVKEGKAIFDLKCSSCHKLSSEKLVGPGWKDVTKRRQALWIANMITNVDMMLEKDAEAQKLLESCLVRMPNQNISEKEARSIIEFMRSNDGEK